MAWFPAYLWTQRKIFGSMIVKELTDRFEASSLTASVPNSPKQIPQKKNSAQWSKWILHVPTKLRSTRFRRQNKEEGVKEIILLFCIRQTAVNYVLSNLYAVYDDTLYIMTIEHNSQRR